MSEASSLREVDVVAWRSSGDAVLCSQEPLSAVVDVADECGLVTATAAVEARLGSSVALRRLTDTNLHVELLDDDHRHVWRDADDTSVGNELPWYRSGWYSATTRLIEATLDEFGMHMRRRPQQRKHWSISALMSVDTSDGTLWFKQVPAFMAHEGALLRWLDRLRPALVPEPVAVGSDWVLMRAFPEHVDGASHDSPFGALAELQSAAASAADDLLALGCPDRRLAVLRADLVHLVERADLVDEPIREQLRDALPAVDTCLAELFDTGIEQSVVHGDLHNGNWIRRRDGTWLIFDWTDGCVAHPFMDLGVIPSRDQELRRARVHQYLASWQVAGIGDESIDRIHRAAEPLAAGFHAVSYQRIVDNLEGSDAVGWKPVVTSFLKRLLDLL